MKKRILIFIKTIVGIGLTIAVILYFVINIYPALKQCYSMDIESAPGIEHTIMSLKICTFIIFELYFCSLFISALVINMIFVKNKKRTMTGILQIVLLLMVCGAVCAFMIIHLMDTDYYVISIVAAIVGYILQIAVAFSNKIIDYYQTKKHRIRQE